MKLIASSPNWRFYEVIIAIPTYNRSENLLKLLQYILSFPINHDYDFGIIILDNQSEIICSKTTELLRQIKGFGIRFYQNSSQIGPDENIVRVMEIAKDHCNWVYPLGDSKLPVENFISLLFETIKSPKINNSKLIFFSFDNLNLNVCINCYLEFYRYEPKFGDTLLVGNSLVRSAYLENNIWVLYNNTHTRAILPAALIDCLNNNKPIALVASKIISKAVQKPQSYNPKLSLLECLSMFPLLIANIKRKSDRKNFLKFINRDLSINDKWNVLKFCLLKIYKEKVSITYLLEDISTFRYRYNRFSIEHLVIKSLITLSKLHNNHD